MFRTVDDWGWRLPWAARYTMSIVGLVGCALLACLGAEPEAIARLAPPDAPGRPVATPNAGGPDVLMDAPGGVASTHVIVRVRDGAIQPARLDDGRWTFRTAVAAEQNNAEHQAAAGNGGLPSQAELQLAQRLERWPILDIAPTLRQKPENADLAAAIGLDRYFSVKVPPGTNVARLKSDLEASDALIEMAELDGIGTIADDPPSDPHFDLQYALENTGQLIQGVPGVAGADINMVDAWQFTTGTPDITIAVIDSGVNAHTDLDGRLLTGWNVVAGNSDTSDQCSSHGTHVAGVIAATGNNEIGIAGMNWHANILPVVVLTFCSGNQSDAADGVIFATDRGAQVINMSLQYPNGQSVLHDAIQYAYNAGSIIVAAAGNNGMSCTVPFTCASQTCVAYPARWPETIAVAATTNTDGIWSGSNCGPELNVAAPGRGVLSLTNFSTYGYKDGTSMAAPHVSGLISLMLAIDPELTFGEIRDILEMTAVDLGDAGFDQDFGHGRIDAYAALLEVAGVSAIPGDLNNDGEVNVTDLLLLLGEWGACPGGSQGPPDCPADLNSDSEVDVADLLLLLANWG